MQLVKVAIELISQLALLKDILKANGVMKYRSGFKNFKTKVKTSLVTYNKLFWGNRLKRMKRS